MERCKTCRWWRGRYENKGGYESATCKRFPKWETTPENHGCGEHAPEEKSDES